MDKSNQPISKYLQENFICNRTFKDTYTNISNIYVIGDIHGDLNILVKSLKKIKVINRKLIWIGGDTHIVQLGDILDGGGRGDNMNTSDSSAEEEFKIFDFLNNLDYQARSKGGRVHYLIGNHELMNLLGDFRYVAPNHLKSTGANTRRNLFKPGGYMASMIACHSYGVLKINKWIFCHAGLLPKHLNNRSITDINKLVRGVFSGKVSLESISVEEQELLLGQTSLFWNRFYSKNSNKCTVLNETLDIINKGFVVGENVSAKIGEMSLYYPGKIIGINRNGTYSIKFKGVGRKYNVDTRHIQSNGGMIVGHTPHFNITSVCREKLYFADVGLSRAFTQHNYTNIQVLHIKKGQQPRVI